MASTLPVSICMIVKNEEDFLEASLISVKTILGLDDIIVVDTGSTDKTKEIALKINTRVYDFEWCDDFSAAKNFSAEKAEHDWVLSLDADEVITEADIKALNLFIKKPENRFVGSIVSLSAADNRSSRISRLYNRKHFKWEGNIHEQIVPVNKNKKEIVHVPLVTLHYGYMSEVKKVKGKFERNLRMLKEALEKQPGDPYLLAQIGKCYYVNDGDLNEACLYFNKALQKNEDHRLDYIYITVEYYGYSLLNTGQYEKALDHILKYAEYYNSKVEFRFLSAHVFQNNGLFQEAVEYFESCIGVDIFDSQGITSFLSYYNIGVILECVGMIEDAIDVYKNCGNYEPALARLAEITK